MAKNILGFMPGDLIHKVEGEDAFLYEKFIYGGRDMKKIFLFLNGKDSMDEPFFASDERGWDYVEKNNQGIRRTQLITLSKGIKEFKEGDLITQTTAQLRRSDSPGWHGAYFDNSYVGAPLKFEMLASGEREFILQENYFVKKKGERINFFGNNLDGPGWMEYCEFWNLVGIDNWKKVIAKKSTLKNTNLTAFLRGSK